MNTTPKTQEEYSAKIPALQVLMSMGYNYLTPEQWLKVARRFEESLPTSLMVVPAGSRRGSLAATARELQAASPVDRIEIPKVAL